MLPCVDCQTAMRPRDCGGVVVDRCLTCGGLWFDSGELGYFRAGLEQRFLDALPRPPESARGLTDRGSHVCPRCECALTPGEYVYGSGVRVARCGKCEGIWLPGSQVLQFIAHLRDAKNQRSETRAVASDIAEVARAQIEQHDVLNQSTFRWSWWAFFSPLNFLPYAADANDDHAYPGTILLVALQLAALLFLSEETSMQLALVPAQLFEGGNLGTLLTYSFIHSGWMHFLGNALFLVVFGRALEKSIGTARFLTVYFATDFLSAVIYSICSVGSTIPCVGASGAISGIQGTYFLLMPKAKVKMLFGARQLRVPAWIYLGFWFVAEVFSAWAGLAPGVASSAHLGGFLAGAAVGYRLRKADD